MSTENQESVPDSHPKKTTWKEKLWEGVRVFFVPIAIVFLIRFYIAQPFIVKGESMEPNFEDHEYLIVDELTPVLQPLERGTVIVFRYPLQPSDFFIKRVIGLPKEHVSIKNGEITINTSDKKTLVLSESYLARGTVTKDDGEFDVPENNYFVLGDNRSFSLDSRRFGFLSKKFVVGRAYIRLWPPQRMGFMHAAEY